MWHTFARGYQNQYILRIEDANQLETRKRRISKVVERSIKNLKPGVKE
jgi:uncharacterized protein YdeI (YjbR/CyaY-like superfamily)